MVNKQLIISSLLSLVFVLTAFVVSAEVSVDAGKQLFKANCAQCHNRNMKDNLTGPALGGVQERWAGREELLYGWIRNSQSVIASGDPYAVDLYNTWNKVLMNPFPNLTDDEIGSILAYVDAVYTGTEGGAAAAGPVAVVEQPKTNYTLIYGVLALLLALIALSLATSSVRPTPPARPRCKSNRCRARNASTANMAGSTGGTVSGTSPPSINARSAPISPIPPC